MSHDRRLRLVTADSQPSAADRVDRFTNSVHKYTRRLIGGVALLGVIGAGVAVYNAVKPKHSKAKDPIGLFAERTHMQEARATIAPSGSNLQRILWKSGYGNNSQGIANEMDVPHEGGLAAGDIVIVKEGVPEEFEGKTELVLVPEDEELPQVAEQTYEGEAGPSGIAHIGGKDVPIVRENQHGVLEMPAPGVVSEDPR